VEIPQGRVRARCVRVVRNLRVPVEWVIRGVLTSDSSDFDIRGRHYDHG
jgi:hypothetical protein